MGGELITYGRPPVTAVLVDDHPVVREGIRAWCRVSRDVDLVASGRGPEVTREPPGSHADIVILDLLLEGRDQPAWDALQHLVAAGRRVVVYSMRDDEATALRALEYGCSTYLTKAEGETHLIAAVVAAATDHPYVPPALAGAMTVDAGPDRPALTTREKEVLLAWFQSESKNLVAQRLGLSPRTVSGYLDRVRVRYARVGREAPTKAALVARALQDGLVSLDDL
jgi:DNA-binding NarL/FixJ family response regulator